MNRKRASSAAVLIFVLVIVAIWAMPVAAQVPTNEFTLCKETIPRGLDQVFQFEAGEIVPNGVQGKPFTLKDGECETFELSIGWEYYFEEEVPEGWEARVHCDFVRPAPPDEAELLNDSVRVTVSLEDDGECTFTNVAPETETAPPPPPPPFVPEASTFMLLGGAATTLAGYVGLQIRARRRK